MRTVIRSFRVLTIIAAAFGVPSLASAGILGFGDFSQFSVNVDDTGSLPVVSPGTIELTTGKGEGRSIFYNTPQNISHFTASFTYQSSGADPRDYAGAAFVIQNASQGASAVSTDAFGYQGLANSAAIILDLADDETGFFKNGIIGGGSVSTSPVDLRSGHPINVTLVYNGTTLAETLTDTLTSSTFSQTYLLSPNLSAMIGSSTAYVGLTAAVGAAYGTDAQFFSNFQFQSVPEPSSCALAGLAALGLLAHLGRKRRR